MAGSGQWNCFMGTCDTGWSRVMGLIYGGVGHWLERVMGLIQGACHRGTWHLLDQGDGIDLWGCAVGHATRAGSGRWDWFMGYVMGAHDWIGEMGLIWGGTPLGCDAGWDTSWGRDWIREMGLICGGMPWGGGGGGGGGGAILAGCELWDWFIGVFHGGRNWIGAMELICGGEPWGRMTLARSGWGDWFIRARHEGVRHWLDWGYGIDPWARVEWQSTIWLLNVNDKILYGCWM